MLPCHHPALQAGDGLVLPIGVGGTGLGTTRSMGADRERIPRNSPEIFNRGAAEWHSMFWDSRVSGTVATGFDTPAEEKLPKGFDNILAVQAMFPVTSRDEMRGEIADYHNYGGENELALISNAAPQSIWRALMRRLLAIPEYVALFEEAYPDISSEELGFQHAANAIAAFEIEAFTFLDSPWDKYLAGERKAMSKSAKRGALLFYGKAGCVSCHSGSLMTDQEHHNIGIPQLGPGKVDESTLDVGRYAETGKMEDLFAFRTPPLRNVAITGPWMHNGAYAELESAIRHHLDPVGMLKNYDATQIPEELRHTYQNEEALVQRMLRTLDPKIGLKTGNLSRGEVRDLLVFLEALTEEGAERMQEEAIPKTVPSGLPVDNMSGKISARVPTGY